MAKREQKAASAHYSSDKETERLAVQSRLLKKFDGEAYSKVFAGYDHPCVLDVGCGNVDMLIDRLSGSYDDDGYALIGVEMNEEKVEKTRSAHLAPNRSFIACDLDSDDMTSAVLAEMGRRGIKVFDVVNISMVLFHLGSSEDLLTRIHEVLRPGGTIIVKEIDDGLNFSYPDGDGSFERIYRICGNNESSRHRQQGRQTYTELYRAGFHDISLEVTGFSTIGLSREEKAAFWDMYFEFVLDDVERMCDKYSGDENIVADYMWYSANYGCLKKRFMEDDFAAFLGFQLYTAKK